MHGQVVSHLLVHIAYRLVGIVGHVLIRRILLDLQKALAG